MHFCTVMTLVNVLEQVLHGLYTRADLDVDVAVVPHQQIGVRRSHPTIVQIAPSLMALTVFLISSSSLLLFLEN
jgi:hypothetical protein